MPRSLALPERRVARMRAGTAYRQHECSLLGIIGIEVALPVFEAHRLGPFDAERSSTMAQPSDRPFVRLGHDSEQARLVAIKKVGNGEIGS